MWNSVLGSGDEPVLRRIKSADQLSKIIGEVAFAAVHRVFCGEDDLHAGPGCQSFGVTDHDEVRACVQHRHDLCVMGDEPDDGVRTVGAFGGQREVVPCGVDTQTGLGDRRLDGSGYSLDVSGESAEHIGVNFDRVQSHAPAPAEGLG